MNTGASSYYKNSNSKARMNQLIDLFVLARRRLAALPYFMEPAQFKLAAARHEPLAEHRAEHPVLSRSRALRQ
jgi:hypothetical protein